MPGFIMTDSRDTLFIIRITSLHRWRPKPPCPAIQDFRLFPVFSVSLFPVGRSGRTRLSRCGFTLPVMPVMPSEYPPCTTPLTNRQCCCEPLSGIRIRRFHAHLSYNTSSFWLVAEASSPACTGGTVHSRTNPALLYSPTRSTNASGRVIRYFSVAKLVCSRVRLKALVNGVASQIFLYRAHSFVCLRGQK